MGEIVKIKESKEFQEFLEKAQPGDMIEFVRGSYSHWALYIGRGVVVHRWGENDGIGKSIGLWGNVTTIFGVEFNKAKILETEVCDVLKYGGKIRVNNYLDTKYKPLPVEDILGKARSSIDREGYNLIYNNCEHFTTDCRYGQSSSRQVQQAVVGSLATGILMSFMAFGAAYLLSGPSKKEEEDKDKDKPN